MPDPLSLVCPIRGPLKISAKSADGLTPSEEKFRIDAIRYLISRGYPEAHFRVEAVVKRFGEKGRNSLRADIAILDVPVADIPAGEVDQLLEHTVLLGEVKRDNRSYEQARQTQVKPMLDFAARVDCLALYWDNIEQRIFWREVVDGITKTREGPLGSLPDYGQKISAKPLTFRTIAPTESLVSVFDRIEDILHSASVPQSKRYGVMLQFLLAKLYDEHSHENKPDSPLEVQDVEALATPVSIAVQKFDQLLKQAASYYGKYLQTPIGEKVNLSGEALRDVLRVLAPVKIVASKHNVIQEFYMRFTKGLYKWEMGQYFTPTTVTDFIVEVLNPQFGEHIKDPACGSADFLTAAFRIGRQFDPNYADTVWGADDSPEAVQVAVLNMLLNGDGKTNIVKEDSLANVNKYESKYDAVVCNPPFGQKIVERRQDVLKLYSLGHVWSEDGGRLQEEPKLLEKQE
ncbi:MAG: N-6 DNA methylase, partial [Candidatus Brocadiales bacterium]|nr:N-6 DNA methylase [Candidatus Bathyanammoxibius sp.]